MSTLEILRAARAVIENPKHHCQTSGAMDAFGESIDPIDPNAVKWCAWGAIRKVVGLGLEPRAPAIAALAIVMGWGGNDDTRSPLSTIYDFNDSHVHEVVLQRFDDALEIVRDLP